MANETSHNKVINDLLLTQVGTFLADVPDDRPFKEVVTAVQERFYVSELMAFELVRIVAKYRTYQRLMGKKK